MSRRSYIYIGIAIVVLSGGLAMWYRLKPPIVTTLAPQVQADPESLSHVDTPGPTAPTGASSAASLKGSQLYSNAYYHFTVMYPSNLAIQEYAEASGGRTLVFQENEPTTTPQNDEPINLRGFQIFIIPYKDSQISPERFQLDEPSGVRTSSQAVTIDGVPAVLFYGQNSIMGDTRELWMIHDGFLYEISTYKPLDSWLADIMKTWKFIPTP